jgi:NAD-dependent dihydropyrimidine dehydrogenase PreA subunit
MSYVINRDDCIQCGSCENECPEGAIIDVDRYYVVDASLCKDCGSCADVCPTAAAAPA